MAKKSGEGGEATNIACRVQDLQLGGQGFGREFKTGVTLGRLGLQGIVEVLSKQCIGVDG